MGWTNAGGWSGRGWGRAVAVAATTTLNPSDKQANITLTNGNLTAQNSVGGAADGVRSISSFSGSKKFYSLHLDSYILGNGFVGIGTGSVSLTSGDPKFAAGAGAALDGNGNIYSDGTLWHTFAVAPANGDTIDVAIDDANKKIWFRISNGNWNDSGTANPATNAGGYAYTATGSLYAYLCLFDNPSIVTMNFGGSAYTYAAPSGFSNL